MVEAEPEMKEFHILSLGAGVQSTALYVMFMRGEIFKPVPATTENLGMAAEDGEPIKLDAAIFADTQEEPAAVYKHLDWLLSLNGPPILVRTVGKLGDDLVNGRNSTGGRFASIPAFTTKDGGETTGITRRQCSKEYKTEVINRTIRREVLGLQPRQRVPRDAHVSSYMGISLDEAGRAARITEMFKKENRAFHPRFPLIERFMTRTNCISFLADKVPHETPRSACTFCPYHNDYEWDRIKREDPDGWQRAVQVDHALREQGSVVNRAMDQVMYLHRSCKPLDLVQLDTKPDLRKSQLGINFAAECEGMCGV